MVYQKGQWLPDVGKNLAVFFFVVLWVLPTLGLLVSSLRDKDALANSGWWTAFGDSRQVDKIRLAGASVQIEKDGAYEIVGNLFGEEGTKGSIVRFGLKVVEPTRYSIGETAKFKNGSTLTLQENGDYAWRSEKPFAHDRGKNVYVETSVPPRFTLENYGEVLSKTGMGRSFVNSFTVAIPATFIPILIAAFAAYALAWMRFPGRKLLIATVVGLLVVPLQMSLIPVLRFYNVLGSWFGFDPKNYVGIWLAHTGFGLPLAIYLLYSYMASLPKDLVEAARLDGADHFRTFTKVVLPLSFPALASFGIFQFLWVWNDLLVALVFLGKKAHQNVLTSKMRELLGSYGGNWEILTASAFITIVVPVIVFLALQKYFVRGLLTGSVK